MLAKTFLCSGMSGHIEGKIFRMQRTGGILIYDLLSCIQYIEH